MYYQIIIITLAVAGTPLGVIAVTTLLVNGRHLFYGLSFPLQRIRSRLGRAYGMYALTDEAYALTSARPAASLTGPRIVWTQALLQACWIGGGLLGALAGQAFAVHEPALDFVFTALFVVLATEAIASDREAISPVLALAAALVARAIAPAEMLLVAMGLFVAMLLIRYGVSRHRTAGPVYDA